MENHENTMPEMEPEQAADAAAIEAMIAGDPAMVAQAEAEPARPKIAADESLAALLSLAGVAAGIAGMARVAAVWSADNCRALADKAVPVFAKYAWGQRFIAFLEEGSGAEEIALAMVAFPMAMATAAAAREDLKPAEPAEKPAELPALVPVSPAGNAAMGGPFDVPEYRRNANE